MRRLLGLFLVVALVVPQYLLGMEAVVSHAVFYRRDARAGGMLVPIVEAYWQVNPKKLHYTTTPENTIVARIKADIVFMADTGIVKQDHFILVTPPRANADELTTLNIIDQRRYLLPKGNIRMKLQLTDMADVNNSFLFADSFMVAPAPDSMFFGSLQLLDTMLESDAESPFLKNGRQQIPSCSNFLDDHRTNLHYYGEHYVPATAKYPLIRKVYLSKNEHDIPMPGYLHRDTIAAGDGPAFAGSFPIRKLVSGNYYLAAVVTDARNTVLASSSYFFQRLNTHPAKDEVTEKQEAADALDTGMEHITVLDLGKTFVAKYTTAEVKAILKMILPFADQAGQQAIKGFIKKPDDMYMRYFVYNFFAAINKKNPTKAWKDYSEKIMEVNKLFSSQGTPGYETERGIIYLKYGAPTEIVTMENETGTYPYQIWQYNTLEQQNNKDIANAVFLFYKQNQLMGDYRLLHSTVAGELQNMAWRTFLYTNSQGGANFNSRAEQYIGNR